MEKQGKETEMAKIVTDAYTLVSQLTHTGLGAVATGNIPPPGHGWPEGQQVLAIHIKAAREFMNAGDKPSVSEINARLEGPLVQKTELTGDAKFTVISALGPPAAAQPQLPAKDVN